MSRARTINESSTVGSVPSLEKGMEAERRVVKNI